MDEDTVRRLRRLAMKWVSQARHPMRVNRPEERDLLIKCAAELQQEIRAERTGVNGPRRSCCPTRPGEDHTCARPVADAGKGNG